MRLVCLRGKEQDEMIFLENNNLGVVGVELHGKGDNYGKTKLCNVY